MIPRLLFVSFVFVTLAVTAIDALSSSLLRPPTSGVSRRGQRLLQLHARESSNELLSLLSSNTGEEDEDEGSIKHAISVLETSFRSSNNFTDNERNDPNRFDPLIGLYEVKSVLTTDKRDNPVGGKWTRKNGLAQRLFRTRTMFQHLVPFNATGLSRLENAVAEAVNVISLDALDGLLRITIILRGDATPLSSEELIQMNTNRTITPLTNLAVRAHFDPPRVFFGKRKKGKEYSYLALKLGPVSSVILDTTFYDKMVRVGMGGTSGTRFVFTATTVEEAREYEALLSQPSSGNKVKVLTRLGGIMAASLYVAFGSRAGAGKLGVYASKLASAIANAKITAAALGLVGKWKPWIVNGMRTIAGITSVISGIAMALILFSSGGIEKDGIAMPGSSSPSPK